MYGGFAKIYDGLMTDAPYDNWAAYINEFLSNWFKNKNGKPLVLDLACGTGNITIRLASFGYDLIGVDLSDDMLAEAQQKAYEKKYKILFLNQDMRELDLYGTIDAVVCVCDGINYIINEEELLTVFKKVRLFLNPGGVFIFDMNTEYKFKEVFGDKSFEDRSENGDSYVWENSYDENTKINKYNILFYENGDDEPFQEVHYQKAYDIKIIKNQLLEVGFSSVKTRNDYSSQEIRPESTRVVFIAAV